MSKTCHICLSNFEPAFHTAGVQIYCSRTCAKRGKALLKKPYKPREKFEKVCPTCKTTFKHRRADAVHCSKRCSKNTFKRSNKMGGNWLKAMERDGKKCRLCSEENIEQLVVHHIDGTGERNNPNHDLDNLAVVCRSCHLKLHTLTFKIINGILALDNPTYKLAGLLPIVWLDQVITPTMEPYAIRQIT